MGAADLKKRLTSVPAKPGIYFFKNANREIIYIGKARSLRDRMRSYFLPNADAKVRAILAATADLDFILTGSEKEAALLENNYVQRHQPRYNLRLKDDKSFPYLRVTLAEPFPGIYFDRRVRRDGSRSFGPYVPARRARQTLRMVNRLFGLRSCEEGVFRNRTRPCLEHDLLLCSAPCTGLIGEAAYAEDVRRAILFLEGRTGELLPELKTKMEEASGRQEFEEAARWRDFIRAVEDSGSKSRFVSTTPEDKDIIGLARRGEEAAALVFFMRRGKVSESEEIRLKIGRGENEARLISRFLDDFYGGGRGLPGSILLPFRPPRARALEKRLAGRRGKTVRLLVPERGGGRRLVDLACRNAEKSLAVHAARTQPAALLELQQALGLPGVPRLIEGFDISNTGGTETVGASVSFLDGLPRREGYRKYKVRTVRGPNDVAGLSEVVGRRLARLKDKKESEGRLPDLILVDGGPGQLGAARRAVSAAGLPDLPVVSLAKRNEVVFSERFGEGLILPRTSSALQLLQHVRDEAHRFAVSFHRRRRSGASFSSLLDDVPGLGPGKKKKLLGEFKDIGRLRSLTVPELVRRIGSRAARSLAAKLGIEEGEDDRRHRG